VQGRCGNENTHGVLDGTSRQATKTNHRTTIGSREAPDPEQTLFARRAKAVGHDGRMPMPKYEFMCENCRKNFEVMLTAAERAVAKVACPTCGGGDVTPQMAIFTAKTSRKS
jgi:putative FmdB family regulatory protein